MSLLRFLTTLPLLLLSLNAFAVIIEGKFDGKVKQFSETDLPNFAPIWGEDLTDTAIAGYFSYDTDKAPGNSASNEHWGTYHSPTNEWLNLTFLIGGKTIAISEQTIPPIATNVEERVDIKNFDPYQNDPSLDSFTILDSTSHVGANGDYLSKVGGVEFYSYGFPILDEVNLAQQFSWVSGNPNQIGQASLSILGAVNQITSEAYIFMELSNLTLQIKPGTSVPESPAWLLLLVGLAILFPRIQSHERWRL
jgi:hypothetical protein